MKYKFVVLIVASLLQLTMAFGMTNAQTVEPTVQTLPHTVEPTAQATVEPEPPPGFPDQLPDTASKGVDLIAAFLATLSGLLAVAVTDAIKRLPFLTDDDKSKITGPLANLLAAVVAVASGYIIGALGTVAGFLDASGVWQVILFSWPTAKAWFEIEQRRKTGIILESVEVKEGVA